MAESLSILEFLQKMIDDVDLRHWFGENPQAALDYHGLKDVAPEDVRDAIVLADDSQTADFSRNYDNDFHATLPAAYAAAHSGGGGGSGAGHKEAVEHLSRFVSNNFVDDRDTVVDDSVNQQIRTGGGDVEQDIETRSTTASGDGAVAADGDVRDSLVTSGDDNQIGTGNMRGDSNIQGDDNEVVQGDDNTTAFGTGAATSAELGDVDVSGGGALSVAGAATGSQANVDSHDRTTTTTSNETRIEDSGNVSSEITDNSNNETDLRVEQDSHDTTHTDINRHNEGDLPIDA